MFSQRNPRPKIYDISVLIGPDMPIYPSDPGVTISQHQAIDRGDLVNLFRVSLGTHTGTHIDAPYHVDSGWPHLQQLDLDVVFGPVTVFQLDVQQAITAADLAGLPWDGVERALFKTRNSLLWDGQFHQDFVYLSDDAARFIAQNTKVRLVGIDYLSIEKPGAEHLSAHLELLGHGVYIVEGLDLSPVPAGEYLLACLPLRLAAPDGAPVRAILTGL